MSGWRVWRSFENVRTRNMDRAFVLALRESSRVNGKVDVEELDRLIEFFVWYPVAEA